MPKYHCLDTEVELYTLESPSHQTPLEISNPALQNLSRKQYSDDTSDSNVHEDMPAFNGLHHCVTPFLSRKKLAERPFKGHEGLNFVGAETPFFLICAGKETFDHIYSKKSLALKHDLEYRYSSIAPECFEKLIRSPPTRKISPTTNVISRITNTKLMVSKGINDGKDSKTITSPKISSPLILSPATLSSPYSMNVRFGNSEVHTGEQAFIESKINFTRPNLTKPAASILLPEGQGRLAKHLRTPSETSKCDVLSKPIEIIIKINERSFITPSSSTETSRYDICINVFYNGDFSASQIIKYRTLAHNESKTYVYLDGKRFEGKHELPCKVDVKSERNYSSPSLRNKSLPVLMPDEKWNKLIAALNMEADEWGRDEHGNRFPTGKYLELVSKMVIPAELQKPLPGMGNDFGVIDIVITVGRFSEIDVSREVAKPLRYLPPNQHQGAEIPSDKDLRYRITTEAVCSTTESPGTRPPNSNDMNSCSSEKCSGVTSTPSATDQKPHIDTARSDRRGHIFPASGDAFILNSDSIADVSTARAVSKATPSTKPDIHLTVVKASTSRPPHPHRPENIPQKRYRGSGPELPISPPLKRRKRAEVFEELPIDLTAATYMSTRAKRSASMPFARTPPNEVAQSRVMRDDFLYPPKSRSGDHVRVETTVPRLPSTPKRIHPKKIKTPEFGGYMKKKARSSNYNPKLSNRPQNLRRKNSAGEWIIPPCRKNSSGEWETPTKGGQNKTPGFLENCNSEVILRENDRMFQPDFSISMDNQCRSVGIGLDNQSETHSNEQKTVANGVLDPGKASRLLEETFILGKLPDTEEEHTAGKNETSQSIEVTNTAISAHFMSPDLPTMIENAIDSPGIDSTEISLAKARTNFNTYFVGLKEDSTVTTRTDTCRKKSLMMRFFQSGRECHGETAIGKHSTKRWLAERYISPEHALAKEITEKHIAHSLLYEKPDKHLEFSTSLGGKGVIDVIINSAHEESNKSCLQFNTKETTDETITSHQSGVILPSQEIQNRDTNKQNSVIPNHKSRTLKLVRRQGIAREKESASHNGQKIIGIASLSHHTNSIVAASPADGKDGDHSLAFETHENRSNITQQKSDVSISVAPKVVIAISETCTPETSTMNKQEITETLTCMETQPCQEGQKYAETPAGTNDTGRLLRPRTVGPTELKALLESHDRHSVIDIPPGTPLGIIGSQLTTRYSRRAVSTKQKDLVAQRIAVTDAKLPREDPTSEVHLTSKGSTRRRGSSGQFVRKPPTTTLIQNRIVGQDVDRQGTTVLHNENDNDPSSVIDYTEALSFKNLTQNEAQTRNTAAEDNNSSGSGVGSKRAVQHVSNAKKLDEATGEDEVALQQILMAKANTVKATRDFEFPKLHTPVPSKISNTDSAGDSEERITEASNDDIPKIQRHDSPASTPLIQYSNGWNPSYLYRDSILVYAGAEKWPGMDKNPVTGQILRKIGKTQDGYFEASSVLMGVRYVVVDSTVVEAPRE